MPTFHLREADNELHGRLALVTGARRVAQRCPPRSSRTLTDAQLLSGGIGAACSRALARAGCDVALHYSSNAVRSSPPPPTSSKLILQLQDGAESLASELRTLHPDRTFTTHRADFSSTSAVHSLVPSVLSHPSHSRLHPTISILVANAGLGRRIRDPASISDEDWDAMMQVNAKAPFILTRAVVEGMRRQGWGRVVVVGSIASKGGGMNGCHYAAAKGAVRSVPLLTAVLDALTPNSSMALNLATVLAPENITVNVVRTFPPPCSLLTASKVSPAMIGSTGMVPAAKSTCLPSPPPLVTVADSAPRTMDTAKEENANDPSASAKAVSSDLAKSDPGLAIASTIPMGRLGEPDEVANAVMMSVGAVALQLNSR